MVMNRPLTQAVLTLFSLKENISINRWRNSAFYVKLFEL